METGAKRTRGANNTEQENNLITVNGNKENTPVRVRQSLADVAASAPNFDDDNLEIKTNGGFGYTVAPVGFEALQFITVENITIPNLEFGISSDQITSTGRTIRGFITISLASEVKTSNVDSAYYQVSLNGVSWIDPVGVNSDLNDLNTWITTNITTEIFYIRTYATFLSSGEAIINFQYS